MIDHHHLLFGTSSLSIFLDDIQSSVHYFLCLLLHGYAVGWVLNLENGPLLVNYKSPTRKQMIDHHHCLLFVASLLSLFLEDVQSLVQYCLCLIIHGFGTHGFGVGWVLKLVNGPLLVHCKSQTCERKMSHHHCLLFAASSLSIFLEDIQSSVHYCLCLSIHGFGVDRVLNLVNGPLLVHKSPSCVQMIDHHRATCVQMVDHHRHLLSASSVRQHKKVKLG
ncbi:hypothetical protein DsansV1_C11g0112921 [Dioscorea sansibarensis]